MNKKQPLVSVLLPAYNVEAYIAETVESVLEQSFTNFELIIINDGSTDKTLQVVEAFKDPRIILVNQENLGLAKTLNKGLQMARGEYIARIDGDDICYRNRLKIQVEYLENHPEIGLLGTGIELIDEQSQHLGYRVPIIGQHILPWVIRYQGNPIKHPTVMFRRQLALDCGGYDQRIGKYFEDYMLWLKMSQVTAIDNLPKILVKYRLTTGSIIGSMKTTEIDTFVGKIMRKGGFTDQDAQQWQELLARPVDKTKRQSLEQSSRFGYYQRFIEIFYPIFGDKVISLLANLKKIKYRGVQI
ncbi:glycosyltransferase [Riemerella columbina]|uniref:glycosyltransferase n=1 Tax=Riemerella columbina TaxID=103810 RepID=UPI002670A8CE|nr:glycosyltransferase [Riemerella columbina]WKS94939.1 glycosyltransferase [Riemerella columbina]